MPQLRQAIGWKYIELTKLKREEIHTLTKPLISSVPLYKTYKGCIRIPLEEKDKNSKLIQLLSRRASSRRYTTQPIDFKEISTILWAGYGRRKRDKNFHFRTSPSAGALYPLEIYLFSLNIQGLNQGIYHYNILEEHLELLVKGDFSLPLIEASLGQRFVGEAGCCIVISAFFRRNMSKYGDRGLRYILLDAGHVAQNIILAATEKGLGSCPVGAFFDEEINSLIGIDGTEETAIYLIAIGKS